MEPDMYQALRGSMFDYRSPQGSNLLDRVTPFFDWQDNRRSLGLWPFGKASLTSPYVQSTIKSDAGITYRGINFASQDYLSLAAHPAVHEAGIEAIRKFGVHSAGSSALTGNTRYSLELEQHIGEFIKMDHVQLFPTGWGAGFGVITGLIRPYDHVVLDCLSHACLQSGASAATKNIYRFAHNDTEHLREILARIRNKDAENSILVVTESLFSMDSDYPDIAKMQEYCSEFNATLLVDAAHDLGSMGPNGTGILGHLNLLGKVDLVMGSFSKTFASNGGFIATSRRTVKEYLTYYSNPQTFSNALSPVQAAVVLKAFEIVGSPEGDIRRKRLMENVLALRQGFENENLQVLGIPSAIVPVIIGNEPLLRLANRRLMELNVLANLVEYPAVSKSSVRFRFQVMADHTAEQVATAVQCVKQALFEAQEILVKIGSESEVPCEAEMTVTA